MNLTPAQIQALQDENAALKAKSVQFAEREGKLTAAEAKALRADIGGYVDGLVKQGKLLPRDQAPLVEFMATIADSDVIEFAEGDEKKKEPRGKWLREFLGRLPRQVDYVERTKPGSEGDKTVSFAAPAGYSVDIARLDLHNKAIVYQHAHPNTSYEAALAAAAS